MTLISLFKTFIIFKFIIFDIIIQLFYFLLFYSNSHIKFLIYLLNFSNQNVVMKGKWEYSPQNPNINPPRGTW